MKKIFTVMAAMMLLVSCVGRGEYDAQTSKVDSLTAVCEQLTVERDSMAKELEGYKYSPAKLLVAIRECYVAKNYGVLKEHLDKLQRYHPEAKEYATAKDIYEQSLRDREEARKKEEAAAAKAEAERLAKMSKIERIMEKYGCDEGTARLIHERRVKLGMTAEQARAAWGNPWHVNRSVGSYGVHEQWCYSTGNYLYFEDGILTSWQN